MNLHQQKKLVVDILECSTTLVTLIVAWSQKGNQRRGHHILFLTLCADKQLMLTLGFSRTTCCQISETNSMSKFWSLKGGKIHIVWVCKEMCVLGNKGSSTTKRA